MASLWPFSRSENKEVVSDAAKAFGSLFVGDKIGETFFNTVIDGLDTLEEYHSSTKNRTLLVDVDYIMKATTADMASKTKMTRSCERIDAYFYFHRKCMQYTSLLSYRATTDSWSRQFEKCLFLLLALSFEKSVGEKPNLTAKDSRILYRMNIPGYLLSIKTIDDYQQLLTFFAFMKLSIQSANYVNDQLKYVEWIYTLKNIGSIIFTLEEFVKYYVKYQAAFSSSPWDTKVFIYLIDRLHSPRTTSIPTVRMLFSLHEQIHPNSELFFEQFLSLFRSGIEKETLKAQDIVDTLSLIRGHERLVQPYFDTMANGASPLLIFNTMLLLCDLNGINLNLEKYFSQILSDKISRMRLADFLKWIDSAARSITTIREESRGPLLRAIVKVFDTFVLGKVPNVLSNPFDPIECLDLFNKWLEFIPDQNYERVSFKNLIYRIVVGNQSYNKNTPDKLKRLFQNIRQLPETFSRQCDPQKIIDDSWLKDFIINNTAVWLKIDRTIYNDLCRSHQQNPWITHVWSRIMYLSLLNLSNTSIPDVLIKLNDWLKMIGHEDYDYNDTLTAIFIRNLFEIILIKYSTSIITLPSIDAIMKVLIGLRADILQNDPTHAISVFFNNGLEILKEVLQLKSKCSWYPELATGSIISSFLPLIDIRTVMGSIDIQHYQFPRINNNIERIMSLPRPNDLDTIDIQTREIFFKNFIQEVNRWLQWFIQHLHTFRPIITWMNIYNVNEIHQLLGDIDKTVDDSKTTVIDLKKLVERVLRILHGLHDLRRLCYLFSCLTTFHMIDSGSLNIQDNAQSFINELKRFQKNNSYTVEARKQHEQTINIRQRQKVQWSLASEKFDCSVTVEFRINGTNMEHQILYHKENIPIYRNTVHGEFETQLSGQLFITIDNLRSTYNKIIWHRIKSTDLTVCYLFDGIFKMHFKNFYDDIDNITVTEFSGLIQRVFAFIGHLLDGDLSLRDMTQMRAVFSDNNINIREEVKKLVTSRSTEQVLDTQDGMAPTTNQDAAIHIDERNVERICQWLQIYQYYSHVNIVLDCIEKFDIISDDAGDATIADLRKLSEDENASLRQISQAYQILQEKFQLLSHQHLQLIKTAIDCSAVVQMMKKADLYSDSGRRRFQELRDNLTTQFQMQERNNMILNSWILSYNLIEPFVSKAENFDIFIRRLANLPNLDGNMLEHIRVVNDNMQLVTMWLTADQTTVLDNALITMINLYKTGKVSIHLRYLLNQPSCYDISYSIGRVNNAMIGENRARPNENLLDSDMNKIDLSTTEIHDHRRQLTFCKADEDQNLAVQRSLVNGQLHLLDTIDEIFTVLQNLESDGHPDFQLREEKYEIHLQQVEWDLNLTDLRNYQAARLEKSIKDRTENLKQIVVTMKQTHSVWIEDLREYRTRYPILKLYTNREIMTLILLLRNSKEVHSVRDRFLKKIFNSEKTVNEQVGCENLAIRMLCHYLRSLRVPQAELNVDRLTALYRVHQITIENNKEKPLQKLTGFLNEIFPNVERLLENNVNRDHSQQYVVKLNPSASIYSRSDVSEQRFDRDTCCVMLNLFQDQLPALYQILWCSNTTKEEIELFFSRIRTFHSLIFIVMDVDRMHHLLREVLLNEQDKLASEKSHGTVYYFSNELTTTRRGLREFPILAAYREPEATHRYLMKLFENRKIMSAPVKIIYGEAGIGKTHRIRNLNMQDKRAFCFSINDQLSISLMVSSLLSFESVFVPGATSLFYNISMHAPFEVLNRMFFALFICGCVSDSSSGLMFSLPSNEQPWEFIVEVPHSGDRCVELKENFFQKLPVLAVFSPFKLEEVNGLNHPLVIGDQEKVVAKFLKAFNDRSIDRKLVRLPNQTEQPVTFPDLSDVDECRRIITDCINTHIPELPMSKIFQVSFIKFLHRRVKFFEGHFFAWDETTKDLGSTAMIQMLKEVNSLIRINFDKNDFPKVFLVYDPGFSLHLLHTDWNHVDRNLKALFGDKDPWRSLEYRNKDYFAECLAWLMNIDYEQFIAVMKDTKFILTENFAYKLFHIHERKLTRLPLIIEGGTGVGKTFLLKFYSLLLSYKRTYDSSEKVITPQILENTSTFLITIITTIVETNEDFLRPFLRCIKSRLSDWIENNPAYYNNNTTSLFLAPNNDEDDANDEALDMNLLTQIKTSLQKTLFGKNVLYQVWRTIVRIAYEKVMVNVLKDLIEQMQNYITKQVTETPLIQTSSLLGEPQQDPSSPNADAAIEYFRHFLFFSRIKPLFYRLLIHPGITEYQLTEFMTPIVDLARQLPETDIVVFFDEVNTASCLGLFKEIFIDKSLNGRKMPENIFFTAAINPWTDPNSNDVNKIHRTDFIVHQLPKSLEDLRVKYGTLESTALADYIVKKIKIFRMNSSFNSGQQLPLDDYCQGVLADAILKAQEFCETKLGINSVSQREIQRCFNLIEFFWNLRYEDELCYDRNQYSPNPLRCIVLSIALIYYFRLPTREDNQQRKDKTNPSREDLAELLSTVITDFTQVIENELERFVNKNNFEIPPGVAINQAVREHIFAIVVSLVTRTPLCIIGVPGQSKTLSFQIVLQNLQGAQLSPKAFCKRLPAIDPFFCLGSKYTTSDDVAAVFDRAIKREEQYEQNQMNMRCVVFLDEASLPDEKKMVLKVLHPYLDECKVAFVAVANQSFDAANANRMICIYRSLPSEIDQKVLAYGCLGLQIDPQQDIQDSQRDRIVSGLCQGYRRILVEPELPHIFHDRDFIYMLRELRFALTQTAETSETTMTDVTPLALLRALEHNFNGIHVEEFQSLVRIFASAVAQQCPHFKILIENLQGLRRDTITILRDSMKLDSNRRRLYGRYKLIIDESEDESAIRLLFETGILISDPSRTVIFRMSDFSDDANNDLKNIEILSNIKLCMETGKTIVMINTGRIHGSLYDVFNQNFSIMATNDSRKIFSKVAIGSKTLDVAVHEDFQCIVHVKRSEFKDIPAPFLSRFQKYSLSVDDFYRIQLQKLPLKDRAMLEKIERTAQSFVTHFGEEYFLGFNKNTIPSCLLSIINRNEKDEYSLVNIKELHTQLTIPSKDFIEQNPMDQHQCFLFAVLSKLMQLVTPECVIYRLPTFSNQYARAFCNNYFYQQEHLNLEHFLTRLYEIPTVEINEQTALLDTTDAKENINYNQISMVRKIILYTRTSAMIMNLHGNPNPNLFSNSIDADLVNDINSKISIINIVAIGDSATLEKRFNAFMEDQNKSILISIIDARIHQQNAHIPFVRRLVDQADQTANNAMVQVKKYFVIIIHAPGHELNRRTCFPSTFLEAWDYHFVDTSSPGNAFHLKKMLQIFTSKISLTKISMKLDEPLYDLSHLFDDCLWEFCLRLRIRSPELPENCFKNEHARHFYRHNITITQRVECMKKIFHQVNQLQKYIINLYHEKISMQGDALRKSCNSIYQICKDTLCGKHQTGLVGVLQSRIKSSFNNFVSAIFKNLVDDYGLDNFNKLSEPATGCMKLLELIDYSNLLMKDSNESNQAALEGTIIFTDHFSCIPEIPIFFLLRQRVMLIIDNIKTKIIQQQLHPNIDEGDIWRDEDPIPSANDDRFDQQYDNDNNNQTMIRQYENFRNQLINGIKNDYGLKEIMTAAMIDLFTHDSIRIQCRSVERNFLSTTSPPDKAIDFLTKWLKQIDTEENISLTMSSNPDLWRFANICTLFEHELDDLISLYSACRIMDMLDPSQSHYLTLLENQKESRSKVRGNLFLQMFQSLWTSLRHLDENQKDETQIWIESYNLVSKYYPSERVLQRSEFISMKDRIEFMNLAYLILLNEKTPQPMILVNRLLHVTKLIEDQNFVQDSICLRNLRAIIEEIFKYFQQVQVSDTTLMIDIQQWIIRTLRSSKKSSKTELIALFNFLSQPNPHLSLAVKQFLFDELCSIQMESMRPNVHGAADHRMSTTFWDHICLLPTIINSLDDIDLTEYRLPYHSSVITDPSQNQILLDLYFFYLRKLSNENQSRSDVMKKILFAGLPQGVNVKRISIAEKLLKALKDFFSIEITAKLLCESTENVQDQKKADDIIKAIIDQHLTIDQQAAQLSEQLKLFCSIIISKKSWNYLSHLLQSERLQNLNSTWTNTLKSLLLSDQTAEQNPTLQLCHQVQFTIGSNATSSIFPNFHTFYDELKQLVHNATQNQVPDQRWIPLLNWIQPKLNSNPPNPTAVEIKVMLLLNIYYQYYCTNQLKLLDGLLSFIKNHLQPVSAEELIVFQAFLEPETFMIGYTDEPNHADKNLLNDLFHLKCQDMDELPIRHVLVNLLAMILLGGTNSFLWPFAFQPLQIKNTFGFASLRPEVVSEVVHYDCGCMLTETGTLILPNNIRSPGSFLNVPAVYVAYFATFGAMAWHLLLYKDSVNNLYHPILAKHAVDNQEAGGRMYGGSLRARVCHFVRTRFISTNFFLSQESNQDEACILLNLCFERLAALSRQSQENPWIKPVFKTHAEQYNAEKGFQDQIFYPMTQKVTEVAKLISNTNMRSQIPRNLLDYASQSPIFIDFSHFRKELCNPTYTDMPLTVLRRVMDSFDYLRMTQHIYQLSQFHYLLHRTFSRLIDQDEFLTIPLKELFERSHEHTTASQRFGTREKHQSIIDKGIEALNEYHKFADGLIRPGACEVTRRFEPITIDTPVSYLVDTGVPDEGNIIMRILEVLIDFQNGILNALKQDLQRNDDPSTWTGLQKMINALSKKEISIVQVAQENTGVITLTGNDRQWIERVCRASLQNMNDYFLQRNTTLVFDYLYIQSYIIRTYLLYCSINYEYMQVKYQCLVRREQPITTAELHKNDINIDTSVKQEWSHLEQMSLDRLQSESKYLERIQNFLQTIDDQNLKKMLLSEFIENENYSSGFVEQYEEYGMKDFRLDCIDMVHCLYEKAIDSFQHAFSHLSQTLMIPLELEVATQLDDNLANFFLVSAVNDDRENIEKLLEKISDFINNLKASDTIFKETLSESFPYICECLEYSSECYTLIPGSIKGENYVTVCQKFIDIRSKLYEKKINIREQSTVLWSPHDDEVIEGLSVTNDFEAFRATVSDDFENFDHETPEPSPIQTDPRNDVNLLDIIGNFDFPVTFSPPSPPLPDPRPITNVKPAFIRSTSMLEYQAEGEIKINLIISQPSLLFQVVHDKTIQMKSIIIPQRLIVHFDEGKPEKKVSIPDKFYDKCREIFVTKKIDPKVYGIIDPDYVLVNFLLETNTKTKFITSNEYRVINKSSLLLVEIDFENTLIEYSATDQANLSSILSRLILDNQLHFEAPTSFFNIFDQRGQLLVEDCLIKNLYRSNEQALFHLKMIRCDPNKNHVYEVNLSKSSGESIAQTFSPTAIWKEINHCLMGVSKPEDVKTIPGFNIWSKDKQMVIDENQSISSTVTESTTASFDIITSDATVDIFLSYDATSHKIRVLKSMPVGDLLQNKQHLDRLNLKVSPEECILVLGDDEKTNLEGDDLSQSVQTYLSAGEESLRFQIAILIRITKYADRSDSSEISLILSHRNYTVGQLLEMIKDKMGNYEYLALANTKMILTNQMTLSHLKLNAFYLVKESQTCCVSIKQSRPVLVAVDDDLPQQKYITDATIHDVCTQNPSIEAGQSIQFEDFIPSRDTRLHTLMTSSSATLEFTVVTTGVFADITITNEENRSPITFKCTPAICCGRVKEIVSRLWVLRNPQFYKLVIDDDFDLDDNTSLNEEFQTIENLQLKLVSSADVKCTILYLDQERTIPAMYTTLGSEILQQAFQEFSISNDEIESIKLYLLDDPESPTEMDVDMDIESIRSFLSEGTINFPFQLIKE